jgi:LuxR family maltose regulon positive regulatory protein
MTDMPAAAGSGHASGRAEPGLIYRHDLMAAFNRAAQKPVTIISAPAGAGKTSLLRAWAGRPGQDCRIAFLAVQPGQHDMQLFWLALLGAVRAAAGTGEGGAQLPPVTPGSSGSAIVDKVLSELEESCDRFVLVIDDLHELSSPEAAGPAAGRCRHRDLHQDHDVRDHAVDPPRPRPSGPVHP